ncbi:HIT family protein [Cellulomonas sp. Root137]|uniref:HIT family protein n=1 Tax=Cellulomonas sp. Root137 TaxID=1736459 RepID=UPI001F2D4416|nr:HIT family protein [Cellulomonas sp. Root137]
MGRLDAMTTPSHEPADYSCPFCLLQVGVVSEHNQPSDVVATTELALARISPKWWPANPGAALVIPREHHENVYDLPRATGHAVWDLVQQVAVAMRTAYACDGISVRQHNEPAGGQDVWHLHVHVFPRYDGDRLYERDLEARWVAADDRARYARVLAAELDRLRDHP